MRSCCQTLLVALLDGFRIDGLRMDGLPKRWRAGRCLHFGDSSSVEAAAEACLKLIKFSRSVLKGLHYEGSQAMSSKLNEKLEPHKEVPWRNRIRNSWETQPERSVREESG